jgi:predicted ArsR family transcriptional regulator
MLLEMTSRLEALADPVRLRIIRFLETHGATSLHDLADGAGVHLNTVRSHISALEAEGVVVRESGSSGLRGRPPLCYRLTDDWVLPTSDFRGLAELLAAALVRSGAGKRELRAMGREWGRFLLGRPGDHNVEDELPLALEQLGFDAHLDGDRLELSACPCSQVLPGRPDLICELATAVTDGLLAGAGSQVRVKERHHDPAARHCLVHLSNGVVN